MPGTFPKMKAVLLQKGTLSIQDVPVPVPKNDEIRVKLEWTGVCHTDVHLACGDICGKLKKDLILGHEGVGTIDLLGDHVKDEYKIGDRVLIPWLGKICSTCENCCSGKEELCEKRCCTGVDTDGTYAEYATVDPRCVISLPSSISADQGASLAPIACAGLTTYTALKHSGLRANQWCVIIGAAGGLGHLALQYASAMAFKVIAIDVGANKMKFLRSMGAEHLIDATNTTPSDLEKEVTKLVPQGVHATLVLAPHSSAYDSALSITRRGGNVMCVALPKDAVNVNMQNVISHGLHLIGSIVGDRQDLREALQFAIEGKVKCVVQEYPLSDALKVHQALRDNKFEGRAVLCCSEGLPSKRAQELKQQACSGTQ